MGKVGQDTGPRATGPGRRHGRWRVLVRVQAPASLASAGRLGLSGQFNEVDTAQSWTVRGDLLLRSHHVNLSLVDPRAAGPRGALLSLTVDFPPGVDLQRVRMRPIELPRVLAIYYNNRAAETLAAGHVGEAYWLVRAALMQDPAFTPAHNTLGVVYRRSGRLALAASVFEQLLARQGDDPGVLANLALLRRDQGRLAEAAALRARLAAVVGTRPTTVVPGLTSARFGAAAHSAPIVRAR